MLFYGLTQEDEIRRLSQLVCDCLGYGSNGSAMDLLIETAGVETNHGKYFDRTKNAGTGICQFDRLPFYDVKERTSRENKKKIFNTFGIHVDWVEWSDLRYNPLLSLIFCRLKYLLVPDAIPPDIIGRAKYWKAWYNSELGRGTVDGYLEANNHYIV